MARPPKFDDDVILDRAMLAFWQRGSTQCSIRDLEEILDLKAPSIYRRYGTKDGLACAVVDHYVDRIVGGRVRSYLSGDGDPIDNIAGFLESSVTEAGGGQRLWGCLLTTVSLEVGESREPDAELTQALRRGLAAIEAGFRAEVERAAGLGRLAPGVTADAAVATLTLAMQGLMALARSGVSPADLQRRARSSVAVLADRAP